MENMKELRIHTLRGDIQQIGMESDFNKRGIRHILFSRYVHGTEIPVTREEFDSVLDEEYKKVQAWRHRQLKSRSDTCVYFTYRKAQSGNCRLEGYAPFDCGICTSYKKKCESDVVI